MNNERFQQRLNEFNQALARLQNAISQPENEFTRDSVIQRFEFTYELAWKTLKLYLADKDLDVRNAKDTLKEALQQGIIHDGSLWSELHKTRNLTSHTYDEALAKEVFMYIKDHAVRLFMALSETLQQRL